MKCPLCNLKLEKAILANVEVDYCPRCYGLWFEENELQWAKDGRDRNLRWLDIDLWKDPEKFHLSRNPKMCPAHRLPMYGARYGDSSVQVDVCALGDGVWLDRGEFKEIMAYLREKGDHEILYNYAKNLLQELWEVFSGPEILREEILDMLMILKLLKYKFIAHHPVLTRLMLSLPR